MALTELSRRVFSWWTIGAGLLFASLYLAISLRLTPPAFDVARWCATAVAALLAVKVLSWVAISGASFGREERLLAFVSLAAVALGWMGSGQWIAERAFDYRAAQQKAELMRALHDTSVRILQFVDAREHLAPPRPRPATWQEDVNAFDRFESDMAAAYEGRFGASVRAERDLATLRGLRDRDLDAFFRHPANGFQMRVVAKKLDGFSTVLSRR